MTGMDVQDKVVVVTGGGNGIGRQVVLTLLARGARVAALDLGNAAMEETAALAGAGDRLTTHTLDVTDRETVLAMPDAVIAAHGQVDGLINVAGIVHEFRPVTELSFDDIERVMAVNFWGVVNTSKAFLPHLLQRPAATLVNVSSMGALVPFPGQTAYGASKAAVKLFTEGLIAEHGEDRLHVAVVFPGAVATEILANSGVGSRGGAGAGGAPQMTSPDSAAEQIVDAILRGTPRLVIGKDARMLDRLSRLIPHRAIGIIAKKMKEHTG